MPETDIDRLVALARKGDGAAFGALYEAFAPRIYRFFRFRAGTPEAAEDLTQKVFLKMIESLPSYRDRGVPFAAWLFRVARNAWIDDHRTSHPAATLDSLAENPSVETGPDELAATAFDWALVSAELARLPEDQREVIECRFLAGLTPRETAAQMDRSEGAVRVLQHRAIANLRSRLSSMAADRTVRQHEPEGRR
jgi:RNA polymerase sigma-70 factor, ECF subfamily